MYLLVMAIVFAIVAIPIVRALAKTGRKKPTELSDFFKTDICDIFRYSPTLEEDSINEVGQHVMRYSLRLQDYELGTFYDATIHRFDDGRYNLMLEGRDGYLNRQIVDFVNFCASQYGIDRDGNREVTHGDHEKAEKGLFSRWWDGVIIDNANPNMRMNLTIYSIVPRVQD